VYLISLGRGCGGRSPERPARPKITAIRTTMQASATTATQKQPALFPMTLRPLIIACPRLSPVNLERAMAAPRMQNTQAWPMTRRTRPAAYGTRSDMPTRSSNTNPAIQAPPNTTCSPSMTRATQRC
jgi:hypothetical protein